LLNQDLLFDDEDSKVKKRKFKAKFNKFSAKKIRSRVYDLKSQAQGVQFS